MRHYYALLFFVGLWTGEVFSVLLHPEQRLGRNLRASATLSGVISSKKPMCNRLINMGTHFTVEVSVGTPPQKFGLVADTGSGAVIVQSCLCRKFSPDCKETEDCFQGMNRSSTFIAPERNATLRLLSFGSGDIVAAVATDVVRLGQEQATMKEGLLLMVDRYLQMSGHFEGILGLGIPSWIANADAPPKINGADPVEKIEQASDSENKTKAPDPFPRFMEASGVERFSICMNNGADGVLQLQTPPAPKMLKQVGHNHWSVDFQGFSVGSSGAPIKFCDKSSKEDWQHIACAAIPDSGTTLMLGPREQVEELFSELCHRWPRCKNSLMAEQYPARTFRQLLGSCTDWLHEEGLSEVPSIFMHVAGADGDKQVLELTGWAYVIMSPDADGNRYCQALFGEWEFETKLHGPVWIFGTPLFYQFQVVFETQEKGHPASIGFGPANCGSCNEETSLVLDTGFHRGSHIPRLMQGKPRMPSIDPRQPL